MAVENPSKIVFTFILNRVHLLLDSGEVTFLYTHVLKSQQHRVFRCCSFLTNVLCRGTLLLYLSGKTCFWRKIREKRKSCGAAAHCSVSRHLSGPGSAV